VETVGEEGLEQRAKLGAGERGVTFGFCKDVGRQGTDFNS